MKASLARVLLAVIFMAALAPLARAAEDDSLPVFNEGFGVGVKIERITEPEIKKIAALGIHDIRTGIKWDWVERKQGVYRWNTPLPRDSVAEGRKSRPTFTYDAIIGLMRRYGLHLSLLVVGTNPIYDGPPVEMKSWNNILYQATPAPRTPESIQAFDNFAAATARHYSKLYGSESFTWLIWNEPDMDSNFPPKTDGAVVGQLVASACQQIKDTVPGAIVMGPTLSSAPGGTFRYDFIEDLFTDANPLNCLDAFTVHPYRAAPPETVLADYAKIEKIMAPWQPQIPVPLAVDEWGITIGRSAIPADEKLWRQYSLEEQAALQLRIYLTDLMGGLPYTVIYEWRDSGYDPGEPEDNYGMNTFDGQEKPSLQMIRYVWPRLSGRLLKKVVRSRTCNGHIHLLRFVAGPKTHSQQKGDILVAWSDEENPDLRLQGKFGDVFDIFGHPVMPRAGLLPLNGMPLLINVFEKNAGLRCRGP